VKGAEVVRPGAGVTFFESRSFRVALSRRSQRQNRGAFDSVLIGIFHYFRVSD
jgi:hypothetical protein